MPAQTNAMLDVSTLTVGILGGTGPQGRGLAYRLARAGQSVTVGSREARRGAGVAAELSAVPGAVPGMLAGGDNRLAAEADVVIAALPYTHRADVLLSLRTRLAGRIVVDCANPVAFDFHGPYLLPTPEGSAAQQTAALLPRSRTTAAFHHISAALLTDHTIASLDSDILVLSNDLNAAAVIQALADRAGMRGIFAGPLRNAAQIEALAANLIAISHRHRHDAQPNPPLRAAPATPSPAASRPEAAVTSIALHWTAREIIRQHQEPSSPHRKTGLCKQCGNTQPVEGCRLRQWAEAMLAGRPIPYPQPRRDGMS
jgi:8-hydroxy-5-deazaflavin:NADPH oxidoreductase